MVQFQVLTWDARDEDQDHVIRIFGKTMKGESVCVTTKFIPYFFVKIPGTMTPNSLIQYVKRTCPDITDIDVVEAKDMEGFQNGEKSQFLQIHCNNLLSRRHISNRLRKYITGLSCKLKIFEANLDPVLRLMHRTGIQSTGWVDTGNTCDRAYHTKAEIDLQCEDWRTLKPFDTTNIAPFVVASVDIECHSSTGKFPDPSVPGDACFQIAISLVRFGEDEPYDKTCLCFKETDKNIDGCSVISYRSERDLLMGFTEYLNRHDIDIITGWNIFGFDLEYIMERGMHNNCPLAFYRMSKLRDYTCTLSRKKLSSSALGDNELKLVPMPGRVIFDLFD
jgi:DNA polymerase delta subunit 1